MIVPVLIVAGRIALGLTGLGVIGYAAGTAGAREYAARQEEEKDTKKKAPRRRGATKKKPATPKKKSSSDKA